MGNSVYTQHLAHVGLTSQPDTLQFQDKISVVIKHSEYSTPKYWFCFSPPWSSFLIKRLSVCFCLLLSFILLCSLPLRQFTRVTVETGIITISPSSISNAIPKQLFFFYFYLFISFILLFFFSFFLYCIFFFRVVTVSYIFTVLFLVVFLFKHFFLCFFQLSLLFSYFSSPSFFISVFKNDCVDEWKQLLFLPFFLMASFFNPFSICF